MVSSTPPSITAIYSLGNCSEIIFWITFEVAGAYSEVLIIEQFPAAIAPTKGSIANIKG